MLPTGGLLRAGTSVGEFPQQIQRLLDVASEGNGIKGVKLLGESGPLGRAEAAGSQHALVGSLGEIVALDEQVNGKDIAVVPYTLRNNDILLIEGRNYSPAKFLEQIKLDFDQLYEEAGHRRRMMSVSAHDP